MQKWLQILQNSPSLLPQLNFTICSKISAREKHSYDVTHKILMGLKAKLVSTWIPLSASQTSVFLYMEASIFSAV
jgi:hypothetical protein